MNICLTVNSSPWSSFKGGGQISVHYLATYLSNKGCKVWVIYTGSGKETIPPSLNYQAIFARHFNVKTLNLNIFSVPLEILKLSRKVKIDILHGNGEEAFFHSYLKKFISCKFVLTSHSPFIPPTGIAGALKNPIQMLKRLNFYLLRSAAIKSDLLLAFSCFSKKLMEDGLSSNDNRTVKIINPGVEQSWFNVQVRKKKEITDILFFGRIEHEKGLDLLLRAFAKLLLEFPALKLHIVGEGNYLDLTKKLCIELNIYNKISIYGWKEKNEIQKIMSVSDLCVLPSRIESFGLTIAEAMAGGIPVISTKVGAIPEILINGETGMLLPSEDIDALINGMTYALQNPEEMKKKAVVARKRITKHFSWDKAVKEHIEIYNSLLGNT